MASQNETETFAMSKSASEKSSKAKGLESLRTQETLRTIPETDSELYETSKTEIDSDE
jgi:hypothetical protein